jgi:hypothetical protein
MPNFLTGKLYNTHKNHERDIPRTQWHSKSLINDNITSPFHLILFLAMSHPILQFYSLKKKSSLKKNLVEANFRVQRDTDTNL